MSADQASPARVAPVGEEGLSARDLPRSAWLGVMVIAALAAWLGVVGLRTLLAQHEVGTVIARMAVETVGPAILGFVAVVILCEQIWPAVPTPLLHRAHLVDALYVAIAAVLVVPVLPVVQMGLNVELRAHAPFLILGRLPAVPEVVVTIAVLVGIDFMNWGAHVVNHRFLPFWRLHALHHSQEDLSVLTTFRTHPLLHATYLLSLLPAAVLSASGTVPETALIIYACLVALAHANLRWTFGPLGYVIVSPAYHRQHHRSDMGGRGNINFGFALVLWDQLTRRAYFPRGEALSIRTGLTGRPVPVEQDNSRGMVRTVLDQLTQPFRMSSATDSAPEE
jgi:sterol desaturase/sphingolipid hydroxylase (fatty acid hydroxylase superfamily)